MDQDRDVQREQRGRRAAQIIIGLCVLVIVFVAVWAITSTNGSRAMRSLTTTATTAERPAAGQAGDALTKQGQALFNDNCSSCHQTNGQGVAGAFPPLAGNDALSDAGLVVRTIKNGRSGKITVKGQTYDNAMPAVGAGFTNAQNAAVATYVRQSWGNGFGPVSEADVQQLLAQKQ